MDLKIAAAVTAIAVWAASPPHGELSAQGAGGGTQSLVGTWQLTGLEQAAPGQALARVANPVGILTRASTRPSPRLEPVTSATLPLTSNIAASRPRRAP